MSVASSSRSVAGVVVMWLPVSGVGGGDAGEPASPPFSVRPSDLVGRALAGDGLLGGVVRVALDLETERPAGIEAVDEPRLQLGLARVRGVVREDGIQEDGVGGRRVGIDGDGLLVEELQRERNAGATDGGGVGDGG